MESENESLDGINGALHSQLWLCSLKMRLWTGKLGFVSYNKDLNPINAAMDPNNEGLGHVHGSFDSQNSSL